MSWITLSRTGQSCWSAPRRISRAPYLSQSLSCLTSFQSVARYSARQRCEVTADTLSERPASATGSPAANASSVGLSLATISSDGAASICVEPSCEPPFGLAQWRPVADNVAMDDSGKVKAEALLQRATANPAAQFRPGQWKAIEALVYRRARLMVVERTGWGKSSVYFIATRLLRDQGRGPTLIVSPLLALMRNQITAAHRLGLKALSINSTNREDWPGYRAALGRNEIDALLISPERLANDDFVSEVLVPMARNVAMLVVDEAHCISDWGHDFRPDYRRLVNVLRQMPKGLPVLATTATANDRVIKDVVEQLGDVEVQRGPLMRQSLHLGTLKFADQAERLAWLAKHVPALPGTGIIYVLTKRDARRVTDWLNRNGITAAPYFSDVTADGFEDSNAYRLHLEEQLLGNKIKVLVATSALGMGYDKPDLGFVIHYQAPVTGVR